MVRVYFAKFSKKETSLPSHSLLTRECLGIAFGFIMFPRIMKPQLRQVDGFMCLVFGSPTLLLLIYIDYVI